MKKILSVLVVLAMLLAALPMSAFAASESSLRIFDGATQLTVPLYSIREYDYVFLPAEAEEEITWTVANEDVLVAGEYGLEAYGLGETTLTATTAGGLSDSVTVKVVADTWSGTGKRRVYINPTYLCRTAALTVPTGGLYEITASGPYDTYVEIFNANGELLGSVDDVDGLNFAFTIYLEAGQTYYLAMSAYIVSTAAFDVTVTQLHNAETATTPLQFLESRMAVNVMDVFLPMYVHYPQSDSETLTLSSSNENVVTVTEGVAVAVSAGSAALTLRSSAGDSTTINVTVNAMQILTVDKTVTAKLTDEIGARTYVFMPETSGTYLLRSFSDGLDPVAVVMDGSGTVIAQDDEANYEDFCVELELTAGQLYVFTVGVYSGRGSFELAVTTPQTATSVEITLNEAYCVQVVGDSYYVDVDAVVPFEVTFGGNLGAMEQSCSITSPSELVSIGAPGQGDAILAVGVGTNTLSVLTENSLLDNLEIVVVDLKAGDVDLSGALNMFDIMALYNYVSGSETAPSAAVEALSEMTGDEAINMYDLTALYTIVSGG